MTLQKNKNIQSYVRRIVHSSGSIDGVSGSVSGPNMVHPEHGKWKSVIFGCQRP